MDAAAVWRHLAAVRVFILFLFWKFFPRLWDEALLTGGKNSK